MRNFKKETTPDFTPLSPIWIETTDTFLNLPTPIRGMLFFSPLISYNRWKTSKYHKRRRSMNRFTWDIHQWVLIGFNSTGKIVMQSVYQQNTKKWTPLPSHICPYDKCSYTNADKFLKARKNQIVLCSNCYETIFYWVQWLPFAFYLLSEICTVPLAKESFTIPIPDHIQIYEHLSMTHIQTNYPDIEVNKKNGIEGNQINNSYNIPNQKEFTIKQYIKKQREIATRQSSSIETAINHAHKYLWTQSAWAMTKTLQNFTDGLPIQIPENHIYIELEKPHQQDQHTIAAFSFLQQQKIYWLLSIIDSNGLTTWKAFYENKEWKLPNDYVCVHNKCQQEEHNGVTTYLLCHPCQDAIHYYTTWFTTALRMIKGDFQEQVELKKPEYIIESYDDKRYDHKTKKTKSTKIQHRYHIIRYFDASMVKENIPQKKHKSWMEGRPIARDEYEINPEAIIYVRIVSKEHDRTYKHPRYTNLRGKTQHINSVTRLQPMTIAAFKQLPHVQRITRVRASKFE